MKSLSFFKRALLILCLLGGSLQGMAAPTTLPSKTSPPVIEITDSEEGPGIPLDQLHQEQAKHPTEDGTLPRMLASLVVVVLLLYGSLKVGLPKLVERYPNLFQSLRNKGEAIPFLSLENFQALKKAAGQATLSPEDRFKVITSKVIGVGKELHLVEIKGRQLVIGSTAQQMTLLTQWENQNTVSASEHSELDTANYT